MVYVEGQFDREDKESDSKDVPKDKRHADIVGEIIGDLSAIRRYLHSNFVCYQANPMNVAYEKVHEAYVWMSRVYTKGHVQDSTASVVGCVSLDDVKEKIDTVLGALAHIEETELTKIVTERVEELEMWIEEYVNRKEEELT